MNEWIRGQRVESNLYGLGIVHTFTANLFGVYYDRYNDDLHHCNNTCEMGHGRWYRMDGSDMGDETLTKIEPDCMTRMDVEKMFREHIANHHSSKRGIMSAYEVQAYNEIALLSSELTLYQYALRFYPQAKPMVLAPRNSTRILAQDVRGELHYVELKSEQQWESGDLRESDLERWWPVPGFPPCQS